MLYVKTNAKWYTLPVDITEELEDTVALMYSE